MIQYFMSTDSQSRYLLPFQRERNEQVEAAAILALAESERTKDSGFINKQAGEKLAFILKCGYPLWLIHRNGSEYLFDGFNNSSYPIYYPTIPSAQILKEDVRIKQGLFEDFIEYLSENNQLLQQPPSNQILINGLVLNSGLKNEFSIYASEATPLSEETAKYCVLFNPTLSKDAIDGTFAAFDSLQFALRQNSERLSSCAALIKQVAEQHRADLNFLLSSTLEEANSKIKACEQLANPQLVKINKLYDRKIKTVSAGYDKKIHGWETKVKRARKAVGRAEEKISAYKIKTQKEAYFGHNYERRWAKKFTRLRHSLSIANQKLGTAESHLKAVTDQKTSEINILKSELNSQVGLIKLHLNNALSEKNISLNRVNEKIQHLFDLERKVIGGINRFAGAWNLEGCLENQTLNRSSLAGPVLVYVPFYLICYQSNGYNRFVIVAPSVFGRIDFSTKFLGVFGVTKIRETLTPRFQSISTFIGNLQELIKSDLEFVNQLTVFANSHNLLLNPVFRRQAQEGLVQLKIEGWLSEKDQQNLGRILNG
jgi:hypothetical protein